jgi:hypothetical protein
MANKNAPKREVKKPAKKKAKAPREDFSQAAVRIVREATDRT